MEDTNKTLALLLVAAIVVSLGGTIVSLNRLGEISITGKASDAKTGDVILNITEDTSIAFKVSTIEFGDGYVNGSTSCNNCTMWSNSTDATNGGNNDQACCANDWQDSTNYDDGFWIENTGNTNLTVTASSDVNGTGFIGGSSVTPLLQWRMIADSTAGACNSGCTGDDSAASCGGSWSPSTWTNVTIQASTTLCASGGFKPGSTMDEFIMDILVTVPLNAPTGGGDKTAIITVTGTAA